MTLPLYLLQRFLWAAATVAAIVIARVAVTVAGTIAATVAATYAATVAATHATSVIMCCGDLLQSVAATVLHCTVIAVSVVER